MKTIRNSISLIFIVAICFIACETDPSIDAADPIAEIQQYVNIPYDPFVYSQMDIPLALKDPVLVIQDNLPDSNQITDWGATLGRVLFYDKKLSISNTISCSSCHQQQFGFGDTARFSQGINGITSRKSMGLANARYYANGRFFWDERALSLEHQVLMPIEDSIEMNMELNNLTAKLQQTPYYPYLFYLAFGDSSISSNYISKALAQFVRSIVSYESKFDEGLRNHIDPVLDFDNFNVSENLGKQIFFDHDKIPCASCHFTNALIGDNPRNNGAVNENDLGAMGPTGNPMLRGAFKVPSLKNIAIRPPYMHEGQLATLQQVVEHYNSGIFPVQNLDNHLVGPDGQPFKMNLSATEKTALVDFMNTLTDYKMMEKEAYSNPFE